MSHRHFFRQVIIDQVHPFHQTQLFSIFSLYSPPFQPCFVEVLNFQKESIEQLNKLQSM